MGKTPKTNDEDTQFDDEDESKSENADPHRPVGQDHGHDPQDTAECTWDPFYEFLVGDEKLYWIQGKPGSGKSCLMKYIATQGKTIQALQQWHPGSDCIILKFFFWRPGTTLQNGIKGFLATILRQLLQGDFQSTQKLLRANHSRFQHKFKLDDWTIRELSELFFQATKFFSGSMLIVVDGLDECNTDQGGISLVDYLKLLASLPMCKLCVSSRPELPLCHYFGSQLQLRLQDLTRKDMEEYTHDRLQMMASSPSNCPLDAKELEDIEKTIVERSDGVFLWTALVVDSICNGLLIYCNQRDLMREVESLPRELSILYHRMWDRRNQNISRQEEFEVAKYFRHALKSHKNNRAYSLTLKYDILHVAILKDCSLGERILGEEEEVPLSEIVKSCELTERRVVAMSAGLLEILDTRDDSRQASRDDPSCTEIYNFRKSLSPIHRSAHEFLLQNQEINRILELIPENRYTYLLIRAMIAGLLVREVAPILETEAICEMCKIIRDRDEQSLNSTIVSEHLQLLARSVQRRLVERGVRSEFEGSNFSLSSLKWDPNVRYSKDFMGLLTSLGLGDHVRQHLMEESRGRKTAHRYKNYLLLCSLEDSWRGTSSGQRFLTDFAWLINEKADPLARHVTRGLTRKHTKHRLSMQRSTFTTLLVIILGHSLPIGRPWLATGHYEIWTRSVRKMVATHTNSMTMEAVTVSQDKLEHINFFLRAFWHDRITLELVVQVDVASLIVFPGNFDGFLAVDYVGFLYVESKKDDSQPPKRTYWKPKVASVSDSILRNLKQYKTEEWTLFNERRMTPDESRDYYNQKRQLWGCLIVEPIMSMKEEFDELTEDQLIAEWKGRGWLADDEDDGFEHEEIDYDKDEAPKTFEDTVDLDVRIRTFLAGILSSISFKNLPTTPVYYAASLFVLLIASLVWLRSDETWLHLLRPATA